ncbi:Resolvase, N-terminal domain protein [Desulforamulus reducens MI-1]|uniref:Resolvase, N-terminal domain protein n=1 Tax=Desulforamulus reducens (strain ATCC BAA-1160 / DSM 100696 / MI-1) TaxID=349161 RepID=A4J2Z6_DESRM|nr:recombinase family protein [Desulforamulus reducens]ABO49449.1 Resolvase, N-terminal domain protein [Desulforamulus reducens MI-1]
MKAAIYSRKSKFTGKGESIENQIQLCKEYAFNHFSINENDVLIYEDEGFSGGTTDRPQFQLMLKDAKNKKFSTLICYRLDRLSRSVVDFSSTMEELQQYNISFVSIREQFDTSTPMGRAMMYIASVFAQLERETAAERIRDNMLQLAKTGRWLGGITPTGFESEPVVYIDPAGKERKMYRLSPIAEEFEMVKLIFDKYLELKSLTKLEQFCIMNNFKSKNDVDFKRYSLRFMLSNPVYAIADKEMYNFLLENSYEVYCDENEFTGEFGVMAYNKTQQDKKNPSCRYRDVSEWIVAVGAHKGIIPSATWIKAQKLLLQNKSKSYRKVRNSSCLLSGLLKCRNCGSYMRPKVSRPNKDGEITYYYMCEMKERSKRTRCDVKNVQGNNLDKAVVQEIKKLSMSDSELYTTIQNDKFTIQAAQNTVENEIALIDGKIKANEQAINNLVTSLSQGQNSTASKYIITQIEELDKQTAELKGRLLKLKEVEENNQSKEQNLDVMKSILSAFSKNIDTVDIDAKRMFIKSIVENIVWDGENVEMNLFGANSEKKQLPPTETI